MPEVIINQSTFERLKLHAEPLVDTTDTVINRALDALEQAVERRIDLHDLPNLAHTKVLDAMIGQEKISNPNWNSLLDHILIRAMKRISDLEALRELCPAKMIRGRKEDKGYSYLPEIDVSVRRLSANSACRTIVETALGLGLTLNIGFTWNSKAAAHSGQRARLSIPASS